MKYPLVGRKSMSSAMKSKKTNTKVTAYALKGMSMRSI